MKQRNYSLETSLETEDFDVEYLTETSQQFLFIRNFTQNTDPKDTRNHVHPFNFP